MLADWLLTDDLMDETKKLTVCTHSRQLLIRCVLALYVYRACPHILVYIICDVEVLPLLSPLLLLESFPTEQLHFCSPCSKSSKGLLLLSVGLYFLQDNSYAHSNLVKIAQELLEQRLRIRKKANYRPAF
jgi:hypothetical protein